MTHRGNGITLLSKCVRAYLLKGPRTVAGCAIPLLNQAAATNDNFVSGDYNRKTGLLSSATNRRLDSGLASDAISNTDASLCMVMNAPPDGNTHVWGSASGNNSNDLYFRRAGGDLSGYSFNTTQFSILLPSGFIGQTRWSSTNVESYSGGCLLIAPLYRKYSVDHYHILLRQEV